MKAHHYDRLKALMDQRSITNQKKRWHPNYFPGSVKYCPSTETDVFFFTLAIIQCTLEFIPEASDWFDNILRKLDTPGYQKLFERVEKVKHKFTKPMRRYIEGHVFQGKKWARFALWPRIGLVLPCFLINPDHWKLVVYIWRFIRNIYTHANPKIKGSLVLVYGIATAAYFCHAQIDPYEWDRQHRPLSADVALTRPKTDSGRKAKPKYDRVMKRFDKVTDKYYLNAASKWLAARVIYRSVAEAERKLDIFPGQLNKELRQEPWDAIMGYSKN